MDVLRPRTQSQQNEKRDRALPADYLPATFVSKVNDQTSIESSELLKSISKRNRKRHKIAFESSRSDFTRPTPRKVPTKIVAGNLDVATAPVVKTGTLVTDPKMWEPETEPKQDHIMDPHLINTFQGTLDRTLNQIEIIRHTITKNGVRIEYKDRSGGISHMSAEDFKIDEPDCLAHFIVTKYHLESRKTTSTFMVELIKWSKRYLNSV